MRDMLDDLRRTTAPTRRFARHSLPSSIDPVGGHDGAAGRARNCRSCR